MRILVCGFLLRLASASAGGYPPWNEHERLPAPADVCRNKMKAPHLEPHRDPAEVDRSIRGTKCLPHVAQHTILKKVYIQDVLDQQWREHAARVLKGLQDRQERERAWEWKRASEKARREKSRDLTRNASKSPKQLQAELLEHFRAAHRLYERLARTYMARFDVAWPARRPGYFFWDSAIYGGRPPLEALSLDGMAWQAAEHYFLAFYGGAAARQYFPTASPNDAAPASVPPILRADGDSHGARLARHDAAGVRVLEPDRKSGG